MKIFSHIFVIIFTERLYALYSFAPVSYAWSSSAFAPTSELPAVVSTPSKPTLVSVGVESSWPLSIQHLALVLNWVPSLLDDLILVVLLIKGALRPGIAAA